MSANHALFFIFDGAREGSEGQAMENMEAKRAFWKARKEAGDIEFVETVMLASSGNPNMPAGFVPESGRPVESSEVHGEPMVLDHRLLHGMQVAIATQ